MKRIERRTETTAQKMSGSVMEKRVRRTKMKDTKSMESMRLRL